MYNIEIETLSFAQFDRLKKKYDFQEPNNAVLEVGEGTVTMDKQKLAEIKKHPKTIITQFKKEYIKTLWGKGETITLSHKVYRVGRMSYGDYFLEPITWKGSETDGHSPNTLWLETVEKDPSYLQVERVP
jgi:hypothetical protein